MNRSEVKVRTSASDAGVTFFGLRFSRIKGAPGDKLIQLIRSVLVDRMIEPCQAAVCNTMISTVKISNLSWGKLVPCLHLAKQRKFDVNGSTNTLNIESWFHNLPRTERAQCIAFLSTENL